MINNTYKEFQARTSEKLPISAPNRYRNGGDAVNRYFKISDAKNFAFYKVPKALFEENINLFQQMPKCCSDFCLTECICPSLFYLIPNSSSAPSATLYMNTHSKYSLLPDTLSCKQI